MIRRESVSILRRDSFAFGAFVASPCGQVLELFGSAAGPGNDCAFNMVALLQTERERKFGLRQITGAALHHARLSEAAGDDADDRADCVAVRFGSDQPKADTVISRELVVPVQVSRTVVGGQQQ